MNQITYIKTDGSKVTEHLKVAKHSMLTDDEKNYFDYLHVRITTGLVLWAENIHEGTSENVSINHFNTIHSAEVPNYVKAFMILVDQI
jgi:hypothetical protein